MTRRVLIVDDDKAVRDALSQTLELADLLPTCAGSFVAAKDHIAPEFDGVILSDIRMPGRDGFHLLNYAQQQDPDLPVVLLTGEGDIPMAVQAMGLGAFEFLEKPCATKDLLTALERALRTRSLVLENRSLRSQVQSGDPASRMLFGVSQLSEDLRARVRRIAQAGSDALILGPPGSGISKVAEVVHLCAPRSKAPFIKRASQDLSVDAISKALDDAYGGSLFLDEAAHLPMETQMMLAETLDQAPRARLLLGASTNLEMAVNAGQFSADLFYRLSGMAINIPALADRRDDIPVLFQHYVAQAAEQAGQKPRSIPPELLADLMGRDWPGNARALMSEAMQFALGLTETTVANSEMGLTEQMSRVEKTILEQALRRSSGQASRAADALKLPRKTFYDKLARHGIRAEDYRT